MSNSRARQRDESPAFLCIDTTPVGASRVGGGGGRGEGHRDLTTSSTLYQPVTPAPSDLSGLSRPRRQGDHLRHLAAVPLVRSIQQDQPPLKSPGKLIRGNSKTFPRPKGHGWNSVVPRHCKPSADNFEDKHVNKMTASPFKQYRNKPAARDQTVAPDHDMKLAMMTATYQMAKVFGHHNDPDPVHEKGKLKKARLKEMEPVIKVGPEIRNCCGIIPGDNQQIIHQDAYSEPDESSRYRSRTLERRRKVLSMMSRDFLYDPRPERRPNTAAGQSIHCTSVASDLSEFNSPEMSPRLDYVEYMRTISKKDRPASVPQKAVRFFGHEDQMEIQDQDTIRSKSATATSNSCKLEAGSSPSAYFRDDDDEDDFYEDFTRKNSYLRQRFNQVSDEKTPKKNTESKNNKQVDEATEALQYEKEIKRKNWQRGIHSGEMSSDAIMKGNKLYQNMKRKVRIMSGHTRATNSPVAKIPTKARAKSAVTRKRDDSADTKTIRPKSSGPYETTSTTRYTATCVPIHTNFGDQPTFLTQAEFGDRSIDSDYCSWKDYDIETTTSHIGQWPGNVPDNSADRRRDEKEEDDEDERFRVRFEELQRAVQSQVDVFSDRLQILKCA